METACMEKRQQLEIVRNICAQMGTEITPGYSSGDYFTAACREEWDKDETRMSAEEIQRKIKALVARLPHVVSFSMDCYCTLIYVI